MTPGDLTAFFLDSTTDFVVVHTTVDGVIQGWMGAGERVLGFSADEAIGRSLSLFFTEEDRQRGLDALEIDVALSHGRSEDDRWHVRKDGSRFWASGVLCAVKDSSGSTIGLCKVLRDKTDVRTRILALENMVGRLKGELDTERKAVSSVAHELRNPLMPIVGAIALLQRKDAAHMSERATNILVNQVGVMKRLVDDLTAVGASSISQQPLKPEPVDLNTAVAHVVDGLEEISRSRHQHLSLVLPPTEIWVLADPTRLQQMLVNLLNNALKYTPEGGHVDVSATVEGHMAVIRVDDDGIGISADMLPRIFDMFTREGRQPEVEGTGVGLAVVKQLAAAHGGFIEARSPGHDKGASFSLRIPLHDEADKP